MTTSKTVTFAGMQWDGTTYGIPLDNHGRGLWINSDHFEAAGLDPNMDQPTTFEGWVELFQQLTLDANGNNPTSDDFDVDNVVQWAYGVGNWPLADFLTLLIQHGGSMVQRGWQHDHHQLRSWHQGPVTVSRPGLRVSGLAASGRL